MKIQIIKTTVADGQVIAAGNFCDVPDNQARLLINIGKATEYIEPPKKPKAKRSPVNRMVEEEYTR